MTRPGANEQLPLVERTLDDAVTEAHDIVEQAKDEHRPEATFLLLSGGNDSMVLLDAMAEHADAVVHINTSIGIPEANEHARRVGSATGLPFIELHPPVAYEELVLNHSVFDGLPGPGIHRIVYQQLKERCIRALLAEHRTKRGERFVLLSGVRRAESRRRMGYSGPVNRNGGQVWVNPLFHVTNQEMAVYRRKHELPRSEVAANLHMSGECLCGAMADQGPERQERAAIRFFYPAMDRRLTELEEACQSAGKTYCEWGVKRADERRPAGPLCQSCEFRQPGLFDETDPGSEAAA